MNIKFSFIESIINIDNENIMCLEIENKKYFYRIVDILNKYSQGIIIEDNLFSINKKINVIIDYFNIDINNRKSINSINKLILNNAVNQDISNISKYYRKLLKEYEELIKDLDIPLVLNKDFQLENLIKFFDIKILLESDILKNILTLIDLYKETKEIDIIFLINIKQYLSDIELQELYKYSLYNNVFIVLIDSQVYGEKRKFEKKLIIDDNLEEYVL